MASVQTVFILTSNATVCCFQIRCRIGGTRRCIVDVVIWNEDLTTLTTGTPHLNKTNNVFLTGDIAKCLMDTTSDPHSSIKGRFNENGFPSFARYVKVLTIAHFYWTCKIWQSYYSTTFRLPYIMCCHYLLTGRLKPLNCTNKPARVSILKSDGISAVTLTVKYHTRTASRLSSRRLQNFPLFRVEKRSAKKCRRKSFYVQVWEFTMLFSIIS
jgi:hypothetical protein